jgi:hypothetical protein
MSSAEWRLTLASSLPAAVALVDADSSCNLVDSWALFGILLRYLSSVLNAPAP